MISDCRLAALDETGDRFNSAREGMETRRYGIVGVIERVEERVEKRVEERTMEMGGGEGSMMNGRAKEKSRRRRKRRIEGAVVRIW